MIRNKSIATCIVLSIVTCGIYRIVWVYNVGKRLDDVRSRNGERTLNQEILYLVLWLFGLSIVSMCLIQDEINRYAVAGQ